MTLARPSFWFWVARLVEQQPGGVVEDRAGVLHAAELERRHEQEVELAERIRDAGVALEPGERRGVQIEDRVAVPRDFRGVGLAVEHAEPSAVSLGRLDLEAPGGEREEVRRKRLGFREPNAVVLSIPSALDLRRRSRAPPSPSECRATACSVAFRSG